jgi:hypothetical protein
MGITLPGSLFLRCSFADGSSPHKAMINDPFSIIRKYYTGNVKPFSGHQLGRPPTIGKNNIGEKNIPGFPIH